jgi:hypothetical protein
MVIKPENFLLGVRHWIQRYKRSFEIFRYIGKSETSSIYYFQSLEQNTIIGREAHQLNLNGFGPFVIDNDRIMDAMETAREKREKGAS